MAASLGRVDYLGRSGEPSNGSRVRRLRVAVMRGKILVAVSTLAMLGLVLTTAAAGAGPDKTGAAPSASWRCVAGICLGHSRTALRYRYGYAPANIPSRTLRVKGGRVSACFWRCTNAVTEDGFTYYGGNQRPADRLLTVSTCNPIFQLPDGVTFGTAIPFGRYWHGYRRIYLEGGVFGWEKVVGQGATRTKVTLAVNRGRVQCVDLQQS
jgi:hypothetical protein